MEPGFSPIWERGRAFLFGTGDMDGADKLALLAELPGEYCRLFHGHGTEGERRQAVQYIVQGFGVLLTQEIKREIIIPICIECERKMGSDNWTLFYCFECNANRWIDRRMSKKRYRHNILWLRGCPECTGKFGGLYFADPGMLVEH